MTGITRHSLSDRVVHWTTVLFMALLLMTGWGIYSGGYFFSDYATNLSIHIIAGFGIALVFVGFKIYLWIASRSEFVNTLLKPGDIKDIITIVLNFLGISKKYPAYHVWDSKKEEYIKKYHPVVKAKHWGDFIAVIIMAATGLGLYYGPGTTLGFLADYWGPTLMRTVHLAGFFYFVFTLMAHIYLALIPVNRNLLVSMVTGEDTGKDIVIK